MPVREGIAGAGSSRVGCGVLLREATGDAGAELSARSTKPGAALVGERESMAVVVRLVLEGWRDPPG